MEGSGRESAVVSATEDVREIVRRSAVTGVATFIPLAVTLFVLFFVLDFVSQTLDPVVKVVLSVNWLPSPFSAILLKVVTVATLTAFVFVVGFLAEFSAYGGRIGRTFDEIMESLPGMGSVYTSFNEMSELLLDSDTDSFQEVFLVQYPGPDSYTVAFKTAETPDTIEDATGGDKMVTLFMPLAPNPVMGGFVVHVSESRVVDVDMTVEEGLRSIVTSGVAVGEATAGGGSTADDPWDLGPTRPADLSATVNTRRTDATEDAAADDRDGGHPGDETEE